MDHQELDGGARCGCEWESYPQAFRWFPELGTPWAATPALRSASYDSSADYLRREYAAGAICIDGPSPALARWRERHVPPVDLLDPEGDPNG